MGLCLMNELCATLTRVLIKIQDRDTYRFCRRHLDCEICGSGQSPRWHTEYLGALGLRYGAVSILVLFSLSFERHTQCGSVHSMIEVEVEVRRKQGRMDCHYLELLV